jgi:heparinase II/III-like protein
VTTLERLRRVEPAELRFRLASELRKAAGRVRAAVAPPTWKRDDLVPALAPPEDRADPLGESRRALHRGDWVAAHHALVDHFLTRPSRFPLAPGALHALSSAVTRRFPGARAEAVIRAERMLNGHYDVLGYTGVPFGKLPAWRTDPVHGRQPPFVFWSRVPYLNPEYGDHKVIWEINRHQHWLGLGRAYQLTGDRRYYEAFVAQLEDWMAQNPPLQGVNWASMLELAFRTLSWIWALHLFTPAARDDSPAATPWTIDLLMGVDRQLTHVEHNLSRYFSPNTHLSGEALALYVAGCALPELAASARRRRLGRRVLLEEAERQVNADGGHAELSAHYHRYSTDFYLLATLVARLCGDAALPGFEAAAARQAAFLRAITDDQGRLPLIGDDDGGQLFPICGRPPSDCRDTLSNAAAILKDPALAIAGTTEETFWLTGEAVPELPKGPRPGSVALAVSGYYVSRNPTGDHLIFDAGRHGYLNGGHAHADALSIVVSTGGHPFLVDAGTGTYTIDPEVRDSFRSTASHNTVVLDGRSQSEPRGPFHWSSRADAKCVVWHSEADFDYVEGIHNGYQPKAHVRAVLALHGVGWIVIDHLLGPAGSTADADIVWHVHPDWAPPPGAAPGVLRHFDGTLRAVTCSADLRLLTEAEAAGLDGYAPAYGRIERSLCLRARLSAKLPHSVATFIAAVATPTAPTVEEIAVTTPPGPGWHASAFRLCLGDAELAILSAVEQRPDKVNGGTPAGLWGSAVAATDARAAVLDLGGARRIVRSGVPRPIVINGTRAEVSRLA